jgi:hypothetical protein
MKKKNNEIDLSEIVITIFKNKLKVVLIILIPPIIALAGFLMNSKDISKPIFIAETETMPNSIFEDFEYQAYNSFVDGLIKKDPLSFERKNFNKASEDEDSITIIPDNIKNYNVFSNFRFVKIDRFVLYELFFEKLSQKEFLQKAIIKFYQEKKEEYESQDDYEKAILKLSSSLKIEEMVKKNNQGNLVKILGETNDKENWEKFLKYLEKSTNIEIQDYLKKRFESLVLNIDRINNYIIEDIDYEVLTNPNIEKVATLKSLKNRILENKDLQRLKNLYNETSIMNSSNFSAGKIKAQSTKYKDITIYPKSLPNIIMISLLLGFLLSIIYVLIINTLSKRK